MKNIELARNEGYFDVFKNPTLTTVGGGSTLIGLCSGVIGSIIYSNYIKIKPQF